MTRVASWFGPKRVTLFVATLGLVMMNLVMSQAQMTDITSSGLNTQISTPTPLPDGTINYDITGGSRPGNGPNLFHSFGEFSVATNNIANFLNETALPTSNILSRVTGGNPSNIFGTLQTTNFGPANLYLINPAGVMFGPTASLNVGGSVNISTADYLKMTDGATFSANPTQPTVLSLAPVAAFGFLGPNPSGKITVDGGAGAPSLTVQSGQNFSLIGGDISVTGRTLSAPGGPINLVSVASAGEVAPSASGQPAALSLNGFTALGSISLTQGTFIDTSSNAAGPIFLRGGHLVMAGNSIIRADTVDGSGGNIDVNVGHAQISEFSGIGTDTFGSGRGGDLVISTPLLTLADPETGISADTHSTGNAGFITVSTGELKLTGGSRISSTSISFAENAGSAGIITIQGLSGPGSSATSVTLDNSTISTVIRGGSAGNAPATIGISADTVALTNTTILADTGGEASAGDIIFDTNALTATRSRIDSGTLDRSSQAGRAGNITIRGNQGIANPHHPASTVALDDNTVVITSTFGGGNGGDITITADMLKLQDRTQITATTFGSGDGGNLIFNVNSLTAGNSGISSFSALIDGSELGTGGRAGTVTIRGTQGAANPNDSATSVALDDTFLSTSTLGPGAGGTLTITADTLNLQNGTSIFAVTFGSGNAGDIALNIDRLTASNSDIASNSARSTTDLANPGRAGTVAIRGDQGATNPNDFATSVVLDKTSLDTATRGAESGGAITLAANTITLRNGASIQADTSGDADAGSITLEADRLTAENATISSASGRDLDLNGAIDEVGNGRGGDIRMSADTVTLQKGSVVQTDTSGPGDAGTISLNANILMAAQASGVSSSSFGSGNAGEVSLTAPTITLADSSLISSTTGSTGNAGSILIDGTMIGVTNGATIDSSTFGAGNARTVTIRATEAVTVAGSDPDTGFVSTVASATVGGTGTAGKVTIEAPSIEISDRGTVFTSNSPLGGRAGDILLDGRQVTIAGGGQVASATESPAPGGTVRITATDFLAISGSDSQGNASRVATSTLGDGDAGQVVIDTPTLTMNGGEIVATSGNINPSTGQPLPNSGDAGSIDITIHNASLTGGAQVQASSIDKGQGGRVTISASDSLLVGGADAQGFSTTISSSTNGAGNAGEVTLSAPTMTITDGAFVTTSSGVAGKAGAVILEAGRLSITGGGHVDSSTLGTGQGGSVTITATEQMRLTGHDDQGPSLISTITAGSGNAGQIFVTTPVLELQEGTILASTGAAGNAGSIVVEAGRLSLANDALIASRSVENATGDAGSVDLQVTGLFSSQASTVSSEAKQGAGGNVSITGGNMQITGDTTISAESVGSKDAGSIALTSATDLLVRNSTVTTFAANASGGDITLIAPHIIRLVDSSLESSVQGQVGSSRGGNITIDPQFVILQNSQVVARAIAGPGGNIDITTGTFLADPASIVNASSERGISGTVSINSPIQVLSGAIVPLNLAYSQAGLSGDRCAADPTGQFSSFVQAGRDGVPQVPGALSPSPLSFLETLTSGSLGSPAPNWAAARLGLDFVSVDNSTRFRFHSACRS